VAGEALPLSASRPDFSPDGGNIVAGADLPGAFVGGFGLARAGHQDARDGAAAALRALPRLRRRLPRHLVSDAGQDARPPRQPCSRRVLGAVLYALQVAA
jgi:hypothetical protein